MKRTLILFFALMGSLLANSQQLNVNFDYSVYMLSDKRPYVETYLLIDGKSVNYTVNDVNLESKIDVTGNPAHSFARAKMEQIPTGLPL